MGLVNLELMTAKKLGLCNLTPSTLTALPSWRTQPYEPVPKPQPACGYSHITTSYADSWNFEQMINPTSAGLRLEFWQKRSKLRPGLWKSAGWPEQLGPGLVMLLCCCLFFLHFSGKRF